MITALKSGGLPFLLPMLLLSFGLFVVPFAVLAAYSLLAGDNPGLFGNYAVFLSEPFNVQVVINTITLAVKVTAAATVVGTPIALLYWHSGNFIRRTVIFLTLMPLLTANVVRTFAWIALLGREGPIAAMINFLGFTEKPTTLLFTEAGLILAQTQIELPLLVLPLIAVLSRLDTRLVEAARNFRRWPVANFAARFSSRSRSPATSPGGF